MLLWKLSHPLSRRDNLQNSEKMSFTLRGTRGKIEANDLRDSCLIYRHQTLLFQSETGRFGGNDSVSPPLVAHGGLGIYKNENCQLDKMLER